MTTSGVHSIVVSFVRVFNGDEVSTPTDLAISEALFAKVDENREFDAQRVEIITTSDDFFSFSGPIYEPIPRFDEVIPVEAYESSLKQGLEAKQFKFHAAVRLSMAYPIAEFDSFEEDAEELGIEHPNLFSWIDYCISDAVEVLGEDVRNPESIKQLLTIRGI